MERILFKIVLIGITAAAGKSAFVFRIISGKFSKDIKITMGAEYFTKKLTLDNIEIVMYIWDVAGAHRGTFGLPLYCKGARGAIIMFDLTREKESIRIKKCLKIFRENAVKDAPFIIVGNKLDLIDSTYGLKERKEIQLIAQELNSPYFEISVKTGYNVNAAFNKIINLVLEQIPEENIQKKLPFDFTNQFMEGLKEKQYDIIATEELIKENIIENEINEFHSLNLSIEMDKREKRAIETVFRRFKGSKLGKSKSKPITTKKMGDIVILPSKYKLQTILAFFYGFFFIYLFWFLTFYLYPTIDDETIYNLNGFEFPASGARIILISLIVLVVGVGGRLLIFALNLRHFFIVLHYRGIYYKKIGKPRFVAWTDIDRIVGYLRTFRGSPTVRSVKLYLISYKKVRFNSSNYRLKDKYFDFPYVFYSYEFRRCHFSSINNNSSNIPWN